MLDKVDKKEVFKKILVFIFVFLVSFSFCSLNIKNNYFIFSVPWVLFCFLHDKWYGFFSFFTCFIVIVFNDFYVSLIFLLVLFGVFLFKFLIGKTNKKFKNIISLYCFFITFLQGVLVQVLSSNNEYIFMFLLSVVSYWIMRYYCDIYLFFNSKDNNDLMAKLGVFILLFFGVFFLGLNMNFSYVSVSFIFVILLAFLGSRVSLEVGVLYSFLMFILLFFTKEFSLEYIAFFSVSIVVFLLNKTSKFTLFFTYVLLVFYILYYFNLNYLFVINYVIGAFVYCLIPQKYILKFSEFCFGSEKYIEKINLINEREKLNIVNKIVKMEEVFSLVCYKLNVKSRLKKCEKELLVEEVNIFDNLLKGFVKEVREEDYYSKIKKEMYRYNIDLLYFVIEEDVFKDKIIKVNVRCERNDINGIVVPVISNVVKSDVDVLDVKYNEIFGYYKLRLKTINCVSFKYGVGQKAKDGLFCGDSYLVYENKNKKIFAISDGMGIGKEAKVRSKLALDLLRKFIDVGFEVKQAINSINCILKNEGNLECYTTLDLFVYDKYSDEFYFAKNGACNSFVVNKEGIRAIDGKDLPIGIVDKIDFRENKVNINDGDYVVMVSDGVKEKKLELLNNLKNVKPEKIVSEILNGDNENFDDQTILVIKIKK